MADPIDDWLNSPPITSVTDGLQWWTTMAASGHPLSAMGLDFLSIPATSTDVERAFSRGGLTVSKMCHFLSDESTRAASILGAWCDLPVAVPR
ncbi:hypothetical protein PILCRDRAFT_79225 [Piloderma croceum F 1598]|uniref:HAT C-terminal dimerisation domain-containing protein n=1 Tax=Piloderma croceum (strain F 1598) TaxID=765440 RepID=A0A0C3BD30_PILCF|nr:hypothetical protein PILCRDRAFT_79225 [Piloderma croceum F 1598]